MTATCGFCGRTEADVDMLFVGMNASICDACTDVVARSLSRKRNETNFADRSAPAGLATELLGAWRRMRADPATPLVTLRFMENGLLISRLLENDEPKDTLLRYRVDGNRLTTCELIPAAGETTSVFVLAGDALTLDGQVEFVRGPTSLEEKNCPQGSQSHAACVARGRFGSPAFLPLQVAYFLTRSRRGATYLSLVIGAVFAWMSYRYAVAYPGEVVRAIGSAAVGSAAVLFIYLAGRALFVFARILEAPQGDWWIAERALSIIPAIVRGLFPPTIDSSPGITDVVFLIPVIVLCMDIRNRLSPIIQHGLSQGIDRILWDIGAGPGTDASSKFWRFSVAYLVVLVLMLADVARHVVA